MVILGLGSNIGDRLGFFRRTLHLLSHQPTITLQNVSPVYLSDALCPENAPQEWNKPYFNFCISCDTTLTPPALLQLLKSIESEMGRTFENRWGPRVIDIDILAWHDQIYQDAHLTIPHIELLKRPFALWPLADLIPLWKYPSPGEFQGKTAEFLSAHWGSRFSQDAPFHTHQLPIRVDTPAIVGILNLTPDSFSDGGQYTEVDQALAHAQELCHAGAEVIDIGAESTRPGAALLTPQEEWRRLAPILEALLAVRENFLLPPKLSIDTRHAFTARLALQLGVDWINDVTGLENSDMRDVIKENKGDVIVMHSLGIPPNREKIIPMHQEPIMTLYQWAETLLTDLENEGISKERVILDVGIGFGKTLAQSFDLLQNSGRLRTLNVRVIVGHSRKLFLGAFTPCPFPKRDLETAICSLALAKQQIDYIRVHNVDMCARTFRMGKALRII